MLKLFTTDRPRILLWRFALGWDGAALHEMVRRPVHDPLLETAEDD